MKPHITAIAILIGWSCWLSASETVGHKSRLVKQADIEKSFAKLAGMLSCVDDDSTLTLYEGLPHQIWYSEQLASELKNKTSITRYGFPFYKTPNPVSEVDTKLLSAALKSPAAFVRFQGFKFCGGFHPDYALVWSRQGEIEVEVHICFGCHEIKAYADGTEVYCDMKGAFPRLKKLLKAYQIQRPAPKPKVLNSSDDPFGFDDDHPIEEE